MDIFSILGLSGKDILSQIIKKYFQTPREVELRILEAIDKAIKDYGSDKQGGQLCGTSFLDRQANWDTIIRSFRSDEPNLSPDDLILKGFDAADLVTKECASVFITYLEECFRSDPLLDALLLQKDHVVTTKLALDTILKKLDSFVPVGSSPLSKPSFTVEGGKDSPVGEQVLTPNQVAQRRLPDGTTANYLLSNGVLFTEIIYPGDKRLYLEISSAGETRVRKLPVNLSDLTVVVEEEDIIRRVENPLPGGLTEIVYEGKWGMRTVIRKNADDKIVSFMADNALTKIDKPFDKIYVRSKFSGSES